MTSAAPARGQSDQVVVVRVPHDALGIRWVDNEVGDSAELGVERERLREGDQRCELGTPEDSPKLGEEVQTHHHLHLSGPDRGQDLSRRSARRQEGRNDDAGVEDDPAHGPSARVLCPTLGPGRLELLVS